MPHGHQEQRAVIWNLADLIYNFVYSSLHIFEVFTANFLVKNWLSICMYEKQHYIVCK